MIILRTFKGWTAPAELDGKNKLEGRRPETASDPGVRIQTA